MIRASAALAPAARRARRLGVFGGSFDPPHAGHLAMARAAREGFALEHLVWIPAARPPHKPERVLAEPADRVRMLELLLGAKEEGEQEGREAPRAESDSIWTVELERAGPSYTVDTLRTLARELGPGHELFLLLGEDNLPGLHRWREVEAILALARPIVFPRRAAAPAGGPGTGMHGTGMHGAGMHGTGMRGAGTHGAGTPGARASSAALDPELAAAIEAGRLACPPIDVSSTELRRLLRAGGDPGEALPAAVREYARARGIYRTE